MESFLGGLTYDALLVYLDDVIFIGRTFQEQLGNLRNLFQSLQEAHLKLNPAKYWLFRKEVRYLGHIMSPSGVFTVAVRSIHGPREARSCEELAKTKGQTPFEEFSRAVDVLQEVHLRIRRYS